MRIAICGGGPAGLYFALLTKKRFPDYEVVVHEQNAPDRTYGWGIVFSSFAQTFMKDADAESYAELDAAMVRWDELTIVHRDTPVIIDGCPFSGMARANLLRILRGHCERRGVELRFGSRIEDVSQLEGADLVCAADGANSVLRRSIAEQVGYRSKLLTNKYAWYGTRHLFRTLTLTFRESSDGFFVAHSYPYDAEFSTFTVECSADTWKRVGFETMSDAESRRYCEKVFEADLHGQEILSNKSAWLNFPVHATERLVAGNVVVLGDAARTVHFSIGSGTRTAMEDAIALFGAISRERPLAESLAAYEQERRESCQRLLAVAEKSYEWYEQFPTHMGVGAWEFAHAYMTRGGFVDDAALEKRSPRFMASYRASR